ncbi:hypothetical protein AB733_04925 [Photobacterium swingsii]|uniref:Uncharacterized protein n=1 Tax=Photobacterium swingsii TaxID=680026 RepID=A0A0J8VEE0_9GAMM|nr:hypothetical protein [Photobacterium swingsii]KMV31467.1 hypothetical protein AB733_04925 [Photobacterium swingsii]PSW25016.1 hypothetical protein C9I94_09425 [Photobacterium swingsii]
MKSSTCFCRTTNQPLSVYFTELGATDAASDENQCYGHDFSFANILNVSIGIWRPSTDTLQVKLVLTAQEGMAKTNNSIRHIMREAKSRNFVTR